MKDSNSVILGPFSLLIQTAMSAGYSTCMLTLHILCTYCILCTYYAHTMHILRTYYAHTTHILCTYYAHTTHILRTYCILCTYYAHTMHIHVLCTYYAHTNRLTSSWAVSRFLAIPALASVTALPKEETGKVTRQHKGPHPSWSHHKAWPETRPSTANGL